MVANETVKQSVDQIVTLTAPSGRAIDVRYIEPAGCGQCPMIIFSHGANAANDRYDRYLLPLSKLGYRIAAPNHVDSEEHPERSKYKPKEYLPSRLEDYELVANHYAANELYAAGHSFGALIAQFAGGVSTTENKWAAKTLPRAVIALSPPGPIKGYISESDWLKIESPHLVVTGTNDIVTGIADHWQAHLVSYEATPDGLGFALIYDSMDHYMNGAYGRENTLSTPERRSAMSHLVKASDAFLRRAGDDTKVREKPWSALSTDQVEAVSN